MTRKRFLKLVMAQGVGRNDAAALAEMLCTEKNTPYEERLKHWKAAKYAITAGLAEAIHDLTEAVNDAICVFSRMAASLNERVRFYRKKDT